jgi:hypothetical protein
MKGLAGRHKGHQAEARNEKSMRVVHAWGYSQLAGGQGMLELRNKDSLVKGEVHRTASTIKFYKFRTSH